MYKIFWILVFCSFLIFFLSVREEQGEQETALKDEVGEIEEPESTVAYEFIGQMVEHGKLNAVLLAKEKIDGPHGEKITLRDVEFYFPSLEVAEEIGKQKLVDLKNYARTHSDSIRVWKGKEISLDIKEGKDFDPNLKQEDLSSFKWAGPAHLEFGYGVDRSVLMGRDISFSDNTLRLPKNFIWESQSSTIEGAKAHITMSSTQFDVKQKKDESSQQFTERLMENFEEMVVFPPIKVTTFINTGKEQKTSRPFVMRLKEKLTGKMQSKTEFYFESLGDTEGYFDDEKMDLFVTGDSVQGGILSGETPGVEFLELQKPWCTVRHYSDALKKILKTELNMAGESFRLLPDSLEVSGHPVSIWNEQIVGTVSQIRYKRALGDVPTEGEGEMEFIDPEIEIDKNGWKKYQELQQDYNEQKKSEEKEKAKWALEK